MIGLTREYGHMNCIAYGIKSTEKDSIDDSPGASILRVLYRYPPPEILATHLNSEKT